MSVITRTKKKQTRRKLASKIPVLDYSRIGVTVERPPVFRYDPEPERRVVRAFELALPNYRQLRDEM